jgi:hypothetical protein
MQSMSWHWRTAPGDERLHPTGELDNPAKNGPGSRNESGKRPGLDVEVFSVENLPDVLRDDFGAP